MENTSNSGGCCGSDAVLELDGLLANPPDHSDDLGTGDRLKKLVKERYAIAATEKSGCSCGCSDDQYDPAFSFVGEEYAGRDGYEQEADLGLGCGVPTDVASVKQGDIVLDLGSGAGIDAFIARELTGPTGSVIGVDFTPQMISKARENATKLGYDNVQFVEGDIENLPIESGSVDVILSNCVLNLVPHKQTAFTEMYRVLKPGGHFTVSDIVIQGTLPDRLRESAALYAGCISGAIDQQDYLALLRQAGFVDVEVVKERPIEIAEAILHAVATEEEVAEFMLSGGIRSITVNGTRAPNQ